MKINPDPHKDGFELQPTNNVTAELADLAGAQALAVKLEGHKINKDAISVFLGQEGLEKIDLTGENHGMYGFILRSVQHLSHEWQIHESAQKALENGKVLISVQTDGSEEQVSHVVNELKDHEAEGIVFWGPLTTKNY
ncbi:MAG: hypothetical protein R2681_15745 [Pyrinomonadaceae bacterium]